MTDFHVGDVVVGNEKANGRYSITKQGWMGRVIEILSDKTFKLCSLSFEEDSFDVSMECFNLVMPYDDKEEKKRKAKLLSMLE